MCKHEFLKRLWKAAVDGDVFDPAVSDGESLAASFETRWLVELVDTAMLSVREFPDGGGQYFEILSKCYLSRFKYSESDLLEILGLERSRYYDRKKEAIMVFGLSLWGETIPKMKGQLKEVRTEHAELPYEQYA